MSFIPSAGFFDPPGRITQKEKAKSGFKRPPIVNKLKVEGRKSGDAVECKDEPFRPNVLYESSVVMSVKTVEVVEHEYQLPVNLEIDAEELENDLVINKALTSGFVEVPKTLEIKKTQQKKLKYTTNFVKATMSRSKSSKKLGKTQCPKRKFRYFTPHSLTPQEAPSVLYSSGYLNKKRTSDLNIDTLLYEEFGFSSWRLGQKESILSILSGQNTLVILPTGTGKSLIYQMCTRLLGGLCIVISPLLSLINDQVLKLPCCLSAAALHSNLTHSQYFQVLSSIKKSELDILFVTPEKFVSENLNLLQSSLICIDEAHCISKYSTSSRFSYMLLPLLLKSSRILALTASIDQITLKDTQNQLKIVNTIQHGRALRANLNVTVSREDDIITAVGKILSNQRFKQGSVIVYCGIQYIADSAAQWLKSRGETCASYHSGLNDIRRRQVQEEFVTGKIRVIVATVAFGMGIDKANVSGVVHLHLPSSLEQFIQESGRAGRDGNLANVHVIINENALYFQRSLIYGNHITVRHVLHVLKMMRPAGLKRMRDAPVSQGPLIHVKTSELCQDTGLSKERLLLLFYYLRDYEVVKEVTVAQVVVNINFHKTAPEELAVKYAIISQILVSGKRLANCRRVWLPEICEKMRLTIQEASKAIKRLAATGEISAEFLEDAFIIHANSIPEELEMLNLAKRAEKYFMDIEEVFRKKIETCYMLMDRVGKDSFNDCTNQNEQLGELIEGYLLRDEYDEIPEDAIGDISEDIYCVSADMEGLPDVKDICCVLLGVNTERTPIARWKNFHLWGRYRRFRFSQVYKEVQEVLLDDLGKKSKFKPDMVEIIDSSE